MILRVLFAVAVLMAAGCASIGEGYTTRYGLANPESPAIRPNLVDETYAGGTIGQREIEEYEQKYRERDVLDRPKQEPSED